jgi:hypothetical protein
VALADGVGIVRLYSPEEGIIFTWP